MGRTLRMDDRRARHSRRKRREAFWQKEFLLEAMLYAEAGFQSRQVRPSAFYIAYCSDAIS